MKKTIVVTFELEVADGCDTPQGSEIATYLASRLENSPAPEDPYGLYAPTVFLDAPRVVVNVTGGVMQGASSEIPTEVVAVDYEVSEEDGAIEVPQSDGLPTTGWVYAEMAQHDPKWVEDVYLAYCHPDGGETDEEENEA